MSSPTLLHTLALLTPAHWLNLSILLGYLATILALLAAILWTMPRPRSFFGDGRAGARALFAAMTVASGVHTWYYMYQFLVFSYTSYLALHPHAPSTPTILKLAAWLQHSSLFDEAWRVVCSTPQNWFWSENICLFTVAWGAFVYIEGRRHSVPYLILYPLLGQLMAISTATGLFFLALFSSPVLDPPVPRPRLGTHVYLPLLAAVFPVLYTPVIDARAFLPNLLLLHALILVPFLPVPALLSPSHAPASLPGEGGPTTLAPSALLNILEPLLFLSRALTLLSLRPTFSLSPLYSAPARALLHTLHAHPAQSSIGADAIHVSLLLLAYALLRRGGVPGARGAWEALGVLAGVALVGPGVVGAFVFRGGVRVRRPSRARVGGGKGRVGQLVAAEGEGEGRPVTPRRTRSGKSYSDVVKG